MKNQKFNKLSIFIVFLIFSSLFLCSKADAREGMDIEEDTVWKKGDDLNFNGPVYIWSGATLTIEKGAVINFDEDPDGYATYLNVSGGRIVANGTQDEPIKITGRPAKYGSFFIEFYGGLALEPSFFRHVEISGGGYITENPCPDCQTFLKFIPAAYAFDEGAPAFNFMNGRVHFENCRFYNNKFADIGSQYWENNQNSESNLAIVNSNFEGNDSKAVISDIGCKIPDFNCRQKILLKNNWYGDPSGPSGNNNNGNGKEISGNFYYIDGFRKDDLIVDPVIVIPGITGSMPSKIIAGQLSLDPILHVYDNLISSLDKNGYEKNHNLFDFPYEWRNSNILTANDLLDKIKRIKSETGISKVDIVAHSMGGLLARQYIENTGYQNDIDQFITLGTPHKGAPKSYLTWEAGETGIKFEDKIFAHLFSLEAHTLGYSSLQEYIQSRVISVKELLPDYSYLKKTSDGEMKDYPNDYPRNDFLENLNNQSNLSNLSKIDFTNVIGKVEADNTINKYRVVNSTVSGSWEHGMPENYNDPSTDQGIEYGQGDETVPLASADGVTANKKVVIDSVHSDLPTKAQCEVVKELTGKADCQYVSTFSRVKDILTFGVFSPVDIQVVAPDGKRMGKNFVTGGEYSEIPGAYYSGSNTQNEFLTIPNPIDGEYKILTQGTGDGEYKIKAAKISEDENNPSETKESTVEISGTATNGSQEDLKIEIAGDEIISDQDKIPPQVNIISPENRDYSNNEILNIQYELSDDKTPTNKISKEVKFDDKPMDKLNIDLSLEHLGLHNLLVTAKDEAGNSGQAQTEFTVKTDINLIIKNVDHYYDLRLITKIGARNYLRAKLKIIKGEMDAINQLQKTKLPQKAKDKLIKTFKVIVNSEINILIRQIEKEKEFVKSVNPIVKKLLIEDLEFIRL